MLKLEYRDKVLCWEKALKYTLKNQQTNMPIYCSTTTDSLCMLIMSLVL